MLVRAYGRFWERDKVAFHHHGWRLLGRQGIQTGTIKVVDFRRARGVYILYNEMGAYYVGLAASAGGLGGRIRNHLEDDHAGRWSRFSWFSFDEPAGKPRGDGVFELQPTASVKSDTPVAIRDLEALLQIAMQPFANKSETKFAKGSEWIQVAEVQPEVRLFDDLKGRLTT